MQFNLVAGAFVEALQFGRRAGVSLRMAAPVLGVKWIYEAKRLRGFPREVLIIVAKPKQIELPNGIEIPIVYEDAGVLVIDKPEGWLLAPDDWDRTGRNLQLAIESSMNAPDFWARSRNLRFLRYVHRLDADTTGLLVMAKSPGAVRAFGELFELQQVKKGYLAVVRGVPKQGEWVSPLKLGPHPFRPGVMVVDEMNGKEAETRFRVIKVGPKSALVLAEPRTGRTHQIRVHLAEAGHPVLNDPLYAGEGTPERREDRAPLGLRAFRLSYVDPFRRRLVEVQAPVKEFLKRFGFAGAEELLGPAREGGGGGRAGLGTKPGGGGGGSDSGPGKGAREGGGRG